MFPPPLDYRRATSIEEALSAKAATNDAQFLAGGHGLIPKLKRGDASPAVLIDISDIDALTSIESDDEDDGVTIGALTTHAELIDSPLIADRLPLLVETAAHLGDRQVRNMGTVGGNLAEADPEADLPAAMLALDATLQTQSEDGVRSISATSFFQGQGSTTLDDDELLTGVHINTTPEHTAYLKVTHPARGYAMIGVAVAIEGERTIEEVSIGLTGVVDRPCRLPSLEATLTGRSFESVRIEDRSLPDVIEDAIEADLSEYASNGDVYASGDYRRRVLPSYVHRAIAQAIDLEGHHE